jgi:acetylornithine deacetylase
MTRSEKLDVLAFHRQLVSFPSLSHQEGPIADFVEQYVRNAGLTPSRVNHNVWFSVGQGEDVLLMATHLDVVPPSKNHPYPPFEATLHDGLIFGRGTVDAKASVAAMTLAILELAAEGFDPENGQAMVALTACEETGGDNNGLEEILPLLPPLKAALIGEPTEMQPCVGQKGLLILNVTAHGRTAHAARAHLGDNALYKAARDLLKVESYEFEKEDPYLGKPTMVATVINGGTARNVVPDACTFTLDIRTTPAYTVDEILHQLQNTLGSEISVFSSRIVSVSTDPAERIAQACLAASPKPEFFGSPTASDWIFVREIPTVKIGPGRSQLSHTPNEHVPAADIVEAVQVYKQIIKNYFAS